MMMIIIASMSSPVLSMINPLGQPSELEMIIISFYKNGFQRWFITYKGHIKW